LLSDGKGPAEEERVTAFALAALDRGESPIVTSSSDGRAASAVLPSAVAYDRIGGGLGCILDKIVKRSGVRRAEVAGADTLRIAVEVMGSTAMTALAPTTQGAPICRAHAKAPHLDGLEVAIKDGQTGRLSFFGQVKDGH
jgi:uncharacterized protein YgbK (DUF1537 family)